MKNGLLGKYNLFLFFFGKGVRGVDAAVNEILIF